MKLPASMSSRLVGLLCSTIVLAMPHGALAWQGAAHGTETVSGQQADGGAAVTLDGAGNVIAAGYFSNAGTSYDIAVVKFAAASGAELWRHTLNSGMEPSADVPLAVATDAAGNVFVAGYVSNPTNKLFFFVAKLAANTGAELWRRQLDGGGSFNVAVALAVDGGGNVLAAGYLQSPTEQDFFVIKLGGAGGAEQWRMSIGPAGFAGAIALDTAGNVIVGGALLGPGGNYDFAVVKLAGATGAELWRTQVDDGGTDMVSAVAVDAAGDILAAGIFDDPANSETDFAVLKFDGSTGSEDWRRIIAGADPADNEAESIAVDGAGNAIAGGFVRNRNVPPSADMDGYVVKLAAATGMELWHKTINDNTNGDDDVHGVRVDGAGDVFAVGTIDNSSAATDALLLKLDGTSGNELWRQEMDGPGADTDPGAVYEGGVGLTVDGFGNLIAIGRRYSGPPHRFDVWAIKRDGVTGADFVDPDGDGIASARDNCPAVFNPDQSNLDGDMPAVGDLCDACPGCSGANCCVANQTTKRLIDGSGGILATGDDVNPNQGGLQPSVTLDVPPGTFTSGRSVSITGVNQSAFGLDTTSLNRVAVARLGPAGPVSSDPAKRVVITFAWTDANPDNGVVDGLGLDERNLKLWHNGNELGACSGSATASVACECPGGGPPPCASTDCNAVGGACQSVHCQSAPAGTCNRVQNTWRFEVATFSEYGLGSESCATFTDAHLALKKLLAPAGDDRLTFKGFATLPDGTTLADADPLAHGLRFTLGDTPVTVADAILPAGAYDPVTRVGWKVNAKGTKWIWTTKSPTPAGGIVKAVFSDRAQHAPGEIGVLIQGKAGSYAASTAVSAGVQLPDAGKCFAVSFPGPESTTRCRPNANGNTLKCKWQGTPPTPPSPPPPCDGTLTAPSCDGSCTGLGSFCADNGSGFCQCGSYACGFTAGPECWGECPEGMACADVGGACQCAAQTQACGAGLDSMCDGQCPYGQYCGPTPPSGDCGCVAVTCGAVSSSPSCWGECPPDIPVCRDFGGTCLCAQS